MFGWTILEARGRDQVEQPAIAQVAADWKPVSASWRVLHADTVCLGFGFLASLPLPR